MKFTKASGKLGLLALAAIAGGPAAANDSGWYLGGNIGESRADIDDERIAGGLLIGGFTTNSINDDEREFGYKIFGGYQFNRYFALESGYFDLGEFGYKATTLPPGTLSGDLKVRGLNLDPILLLPLTGNLSFLARIGVNWAQTSSSFTSTGLVVAPSNQKKRDANYKYGLGLQYEIGETLALRGEAERHRIDDSVGNLGDVDLFSIGLLTRFGGSPPEPVAVAPAPAPEPVAAMPSPPPPPPLPLPLPARVTLSADSLFDFDNGAVKPAGRQALDEFAANLRGTSFEVITVTGHTDRIGRPAYNMELSTRRAEAVKSYLVQSAGIPASKIQARGVGESDPVTKPGECEKRTSPRASSQLITCLQPDRRVEVEVSGTR